jgi:hypothetical protein
MPDASATGLRDAWLIVDGLLRSVGEAHPYAVRVLDDEYLQQILVQAFVEAELVRLLLERNRRLAIRELPLTYEHAQARLMAEGAARTALEAMRDVLGPFALLDAGDPYAPAGGAGERPDATADASSANCSEGDRAAVAAALGFPAHGQTPPLRAQEHQSIHQPAAGRSGRWT